MEQNNDLQKIDALEYPIPRKISKKYFFGLSVLDLVILLVMFILTNNILSPLLENKMPTAARFVWINFFPCFFIYMLLREDKNTGDSISYVMKDFLLYSFRTKEYIYNGK